LVLLDVEVSVLLFDAGFVRRVERMDMSVSEGGTTFTGGFQKRNIGHQYL
jgi:hypothetical protein